MSNLYAYKTIFAINSTKALNDFWSFVIFRLNLEQSPYTYDRFARLHNLLRKSEDKLNENCVVYIIIEESDEKFFISIDTILNEFLELITSRLDALGFTYFYENNLLSYAIDKKQNYQANISLEKKYNYTFMNPQDFEMMQKVLEKFFLKKHDTLHNNFQQEELKDLQQRFSRYSSYLHLYPQLFKVNNIVEELSVILRVYASESISTGANMKELLRTFLQDLILWQNKLFIEGSKELSYMDVEFQMQLSKIKTLLNLYDGA